MSTLGEELFAAVLRAPEEDAPRLVYADHLEQQGDPHGELIAIQCRLAHGGLEKAARDRLEERGATLATLYKATLPTAGTFSLERGFAHMWSVEPSAFVAMAGEVFAAHPIRVLDVRGSEDGAVADVFARPELARLRRLELRRVRLTLEEIGRLVSCAHLANLRELEVGNAPVLRENIAWLTTKPTFERLEVLSFRAMPLDATLLDALKSAPFIRTLRSLALRDVRINLSAKRLAEFTRDHPAVRLDLINTSVG